MHKPSQDSFIQPDASRRNFLRDTALASALVMTRPVDAISGAVPRAMPEDGFSALPPAFSALKPLGARVHPITADEFHERIVRAQKMMAELERNYDTRCYAPGTSLHFFTRIRFVFR